MADAIHRKERHIRLTDQTRQERGALLNAAIMGQKRRGGTRASALWERGETTVPGRGREWDCPAFACEARVEI